MRPDATQEQLKELFQEGKRYYGLQKEYLKLTLTEQLTLLLGKIAIVVVIALLSLFVFVFLGLALVHWIGEAIGNIGLCYAFFALFTVLIALLFYFNRRKLVILPLARMLTQLFLTTKNNDQTEETNDERAEN